MRVGAVLIVLLSAGAGCELPERADLLVGRTCVFGQMSACDPRQVCLPHAFDETRPMDFRCRDTASFAVREGREPPVAYCDPDLGWICPEGLSCRVGRIRADVGVRRPECRPVDAPFGPPVEGTGG
ncbi:MAG: hypothetical protein AAFU79_20195 [Myxococcota bacterium]